MFPDDAFEPLGLIPPLTRTAPPVGPRDLTEIISNSARQYGDKVALVDSQRSISYAQLEKEVSKAMAVLASLGIRAGDRVAACAPNTCDLTIAFFATQKLGAIWVGLNRNTVANEKLYFLKDSGAKLFLGDLDAVQQVESVASTLPQLHKILSFEANHREPSWRAALLAQDSPSTPAVEVDPWAPAAIAYTSGTTGYPKGAVHCQHSMVVAAWVAAENSGRTDSDVVRATALPMTILNLMILGPVCAFATGARHVCIDRLDAVSIAEWISREKVNTISLVPTIIQDLLTSPDIPSTALDSISWLVGGASMVPQSLPELYRKRFGHDMITGYGLTECPTGVSITSDDSPSVQGAIGRPFFHLDVGILDKDNNPLPANQPGEICLRAKQAGAWQGVFIGALGYWMRPEASRALHEAGWLHTGDIGQMDADGELYILDRRSDLILRGGANVYPAEVERVIRLHDQVRDVAIVGLPDQRLGEIIAACVEVSNLEDKAKLIESLQALCNSELAFYKRPVIWRFSESLPRNAMGKVIKPTIKDDMIAELTDE